MEKLTETGINMRKAIAMGMHDEMYAEDGKTKAVPGVKSPASSKPMKMGGEKMGVTYDRSR